MHYQGDVRPMLNAAEWDLIIAFPPCTYLTKAGARYWPQWRDDGRQADAVRFVREIWSADVTRLCIENPAGWLNTNWRKPDQIIQPYQHGDPWKKLTCLWTRGLPALVPSNPVEPIGSWIGGGGRGNHVNGKHRNVRARSITFQGIANAMAEQWGTEPSY